MWQEAKLSIPEDLINILAEDRTNWHFNPPYSPNFGGLWEAGVKSIKYHLRRILDRTLTFEEMSTTLCQIEACLNSRPLCPIDHNDIDNLNVLTPGHFLIGEAPINVPEPDLSQSALLGSNGRTPLPPKLNSNFKLETSKIGDIHSLYWMQDSQHFSSGIEVKVHYASISRLDVEKAIGMMNKAAIGTDSDDNHFGFDFSGVTKSGERVMGIVVDGSCKRTVSARPDLLWPIPDHWEFEEAATVPMAYMTAFYCLNSCV
ncbi:fatty acid synthase-like, partial [Bombyx mandarina]|uniref:Fatty acid synthase-like n=1 Tax=Bombyx mandarina TaxID=7092 RepID=A0A6J2KKG1_BOMMA